MITRDTAFLLASTVFLVTLLAAPASATHLGEDLVKNSGFEDWSAGSPANWTSPNNDWAVSNSSGLEGNLSLRLTTDRYSPGRGVMRSNGGKGVAVDEGDLYLVTADLKESNSIGTRVLVRGYDDDRKTWNTLEKFTPRDGWTEEHAFVEIPENHTEIRMRLGAGYVEDEDEGNATAWFDDLRIIEPSVEDAEAFVPSWTITPGNPLKAGNLVVDVAGAESDKALVEVKQGPAVIDKTIVKAGDVVEFKHGEDTYLTFEVESVFASNDSYRVEVKDVLSAAPEIEKTVVDRKVVEEEGLVLYQPFNEGEGLTAVDRSPEMNDGTVKGGAEWVQGVNGTALSFDGTGYVEIDDDNSLDNTVTFSTWVYPGEEQSSDVWFHVLTSKSPYFGHGLFIDYYSKPNRFYTRFVNSTDAGSEAAWPIPKYDTWYHVAGVFDEGMAKLYVNGELKAEGDRIGNHSGNNSEPVRIGGGVNRRYTDASLDRVRIYDRPLDGEELKEKMAEDIGISEFSRFLNIDLGNGTVDLGNGFFLKEEGGTLSLYAGNEKVDEATETGEIELKSGGEVVLKGVYRNSSLKQAVLSDVEADAPILEVEVEGEARALGTGEVVATVRNNGTAALERRSDFVLTLNGEKLLDTEFGEIPPGGVRTVSYPVEMEKPGKVKGSAAVEAGVIKVEKTFTLDVKPPLNPAIEEIDTEVEETGEGLSVSFTLSSKKGIEGSTWKGDASVEVYRSGVMGDDEVLEKTVTLDGTSRSLTLPYQKFYNGDGDYLVKVSLQNATGEDIERVKGEDGEYDGSFNDLGFLLILIAAALPLLGIYIWRKW